jgi:regulator of protease activity HflC (stomatin/prohibitin superfamily)
MRATNQQYRKFWLIGGTILLAWIFISRCFTVINPGQRGIVVSFGKIQDRILEEGIHRKFWV